MEKVKVSECTVGDQQGNIGSVMSQSNKGMNEDCNSWASGKVKYILLLPVEFGIASWKRIC